MKRFFRAIKRLVRSRNPRFAIDAGARDTIHKLSWGKHQIKYRAKSTDAGHIERILLLGKRCEYNLPRTLDPKFILDAGSNIGLAALYFSELFPRARIVCCEPSPLNVELLKVNTAHLPNITVLQCALGGKPGTGSIKPTLLPYHYSGLSINEDDSGQVVIHDHARLREVAGVPFFDLIKVDIEGAEYEFLSSIPEAALADCKWIVGEVHGVSEWLLLDRLSKQFAIDIRKTMTKQASKFHACNRSQTDGLLPGFDISILQK